jgi:hypothetical protein
MRDIKSIGVTDLERQLRYWRAAALCLGTLFAAALPLGAGLAHAKPSSNELFRVAQAPEIATLDIPAGVEVQTESGGFEHDVPTGETTFRGQSTFTLSNGVRLHTRAGTVTAGLRGKNGPYRLFIRP